MEPKTAIILLLCYGVAMAAYCGWLLGTTERVKRRMRDRWTTKKKAP